MSLIGPNPKGRRPPQISGYRGRADALALRLLILLMVLCCDPMAIVLVIAASARRQEETYCKNH